jgi:hypothetical protein
VRRPSALLLRDHRAAHSGPPVHRISAKSRPDWRARNVLFLVPGMGEPRLCTLSAVLFMTVAVGASACGTGTPSGTTDAAVGSDASLSASDATDASLDMNAPESVACAIPQDCTHFSVGPLVSCCINNACIYGQAAIGAVPCTDANVQLILASNYDQSCQTDSDCVAAGGGNFCLAGAGNCPSSAINKSAYSQYQADVAKTNASICRAFSSCGNESGPCCRNGLCQMGTECSDSASPPDGGARADSADGSPE